MIRSIALLLLALFVCAGCSSSKQEKVESAGPSPWEVPGIVSAQKWWGQNELGGVDR